jgi:heme exporter protein D
MAPIPDLSAGKYGAFIWPAYAVTLLIFAGLIVGSLRHARRWKKRAEERTRR